MDPPLKLERHLFLSPRFNAFFKHGEAELFLAQRDARVVGRVSAQVDRNFNEFHDNAWGMFGFLEFEEDPETLTALLDAASAWLRERGRDRMVGPVDFTMIDEAGVLIEGFPEAEPMIRQPWQPPYYHVLLEQAGLQKAVDLFMGDEDRQQGQDPAGDLGAGRQPRAQARDHDPQDDPPQPAARP